MEKTEKQEIRDKLLQRLLSFSKQELKRRSKYVEQKLSNLPIYKEAKVIFTYYPLKGEVDLLDMIRKEWGMKRFCFPVMNMENRQLRIFEPRNLEDFIAGPYGVLQPDTTKSKELTIQDIDMAIVPAIAFDCQKNRLGRGGGFYDRFLERIRPPVDKIGVAFDFQILENLPIHPHDQKVDVVVGETVVI